MKIKIKNENEKIDAMVVQSEDKMEKVNTYASQLLTIKNSNNNKASKNKKIREIIVKNYFKRVETICI